MNVHPPALSIRTLSDFEDFQYLFGQWGGQFQQTSRGDFSGVAKVYNGLTLGAFEARTNQAIFTRGLGRPGLVTVIPVTASNESTLWRGKRVASGHLLVKGPGVEYYNQTSRDAVIKALLVPEPVFERMAGPAADILLGRKFASSVALQPGKQAMQCFQSSLDTLLSPPGPNGDIEARKTEEMSLAHLSACLSDAGAGAGITELRSSRLQLVNAALDLMNARLQQNLCTRELCDHLEVNERALRRAFKQAFRTGPLALFRMMRLNRLRHELSASQGSNQTVAALAHRYGFYRLGALAAEYRLQFGELPSETLGVRGHATRNRQTRKT